MELLDAFVAMGGDADGGGCVDATKLIKTIKEEFQMTIDIEKLIEEIDEDGSGEIEFDEFQALLQSEAWAVYIYTQIFLPQLRAMNYEAEMKLTDDLDR